MYHLSQTKILTSIKSLKEAMLVSNKGIDIIDFKNPALGTLGALPIDKIKSCLKVIPSEQLTSATIGDIYDIEEIKKKTFFLSKIEIDFIKIGFFFDEKNFKKLFNIKKIVKNKKIIAILFADKKPKLNLIKEIKKINFDGVLIDTQDKENGNLRDYLTNSEIKDFVKFSKKENLTIGLAGSLTINDIEPLRKLHPDYLGFRGALCNSNERTDDICEISLNRVLSKFRSFVFQKAI